MTHKKLSALMTAAAALPLAFALNAQKVSAHIATPVEDVIPPASAQQTPAGKIYKFVSEDGERRGEHLVYIFDFAIDFIWDHDRKTFEVMKDMRAGDVLMELLKYSGVERTDAMIDGERIPAKQYFEKNKRTSLEHYLNGEKQDASENEPCEQRFDVNTGRIKEAYTCAGGNTKRALSISELRELNISKGLAKPEDRVPGYLRDRTIPGATLPQP